MKRLIETKQMIAVGLSIGALALTGCTREQAASPSERNARAVAILEPTQGNSAHGTVTFTEVEGGVRVVAEVMGLSPGEHGFHIHEKGDCSAPDASSAGGHFNPTGAPHGAPMDERRHVGDLGNLIAGGGGTALLDRVDEHLAFEGPTSILGRAVVVHAQRDDLSSQPSGDAGGRVACGVIELQP